MTLTEFLLARIAEHEAVAQAAVKEADWEHGDGWADYVGNAGQYASPHSDFAAHANWPRVVLAECEAKRRIVESWGRVERLGTNGFGPGVLRHLAAVYAYHPDYNPDWRP